MFRPSEFPKNILTALDSIAQIGKAAQNQAGPIPSSTKTKYSQDEHSAKTGTLSIHKEINSQEQRAA